MGEPAIQLDTARERFMADPLNEVSRDSYCRAVLSAREDQIANGAAKGDLVGSTYPRVDNEVFTAEQITNALEYVIANYGAAAINWAKLTTDIFHVDDTIKPEWAGEEVRCAVQTPGPSVCIEEWRRCRCEVNLDGDLVALRPDGANPVKIVKSYIPNRSVNSTREDGSPVAVQFDDNGFPLFESRVDILLPGADIYKEDSEHFRIANQLMHERLRNDPGLATALGLSAALVSFFLQPKPEGPPGHTWHHHQDSGRLQLVEARPHEEARHTGGMAIWGRDQRRRPRDAFTGNKRYHVIKLIPWILR